MSESLMTRANINEFLVSYIGYEPEDVAIMEDYVKKDIIDGYKDTFVEYFEEEL